MTWLPEVTLVLVIVLVVAAVLAGCAATQSATQAQHPFVATQHRTVRIEPCEDRTELKGQRDLAGEATQLLTEKVKASKLFALSTDASLVLTCDIERFAEGSALKRWMLPGWGATQAAVAVIVWEKPGDKVLATLRSQSSVEGGGLFSMGADQRILSVALDDIMKQLEAWASGADAGKGS